MVRVGLVIPELIDMKSIGTSILIAFVLFAGFMMVFIAINSSSGESPKENAQQHEYSGGMWTSVQYKIREVCIDSCEYIVIYGPDGRNIIHKANCENPFHIKP